MLLRKNLFFPLAACAIIALYFFLRLFHILNLPLFTDEAIYIRWAQIAKQDASWRFISLTDGKQPMFVWIAMITLKFIKDPLFAGRLVSVLAGFTATVGLFFLGNEAFRLKDKEETKIFTFTNKSVSIGLLSSFIYVIYPFGLVYDRMALYDSLVAAFTVWILYLLILTVRTLRLDVALITGIIAGGGGLTKSNSFLSVYSIPFLLLIFDWRKKFVSSRLLKFIGLSILIVIFTFGIYSILRLSPFFHIIGDKNALFVYPVSEWVKHPVEYLSSNLSALLNWVIIYFGPPAVLLVLSAFFVKKDHFLEKTLLVFWFIFPFTALAVFGKLLYPRFILFMTLPLIVLVAYSIYELLQKYKNSFIRAAVIVFAFFFYIYSDFFIVTNFSSAPIPRADTGQYVNSWSAGNGLRQSVDFFQDQAKNGKIYIMTEGTFGLMPFGLEMYLVDNPNVTISAVWPIGDLPPKDVTDAARKMPTYAVFYQPCPSCGQHGGKTPSLWRVQKLASYRQGNGSDYYTIYQILP